MVRAPPAQRELRPPYPAPENFGPIPFGFVRFVAHCGMHIAIIGGGPAGLRAAEVAAEGGASVTLFDAKPSVGRKFLVAGRGGLNLTHSEPIEQFASRYLGPGMPDRTWRSLIEEFDPAALRTWAAGLEVETFAASTGRIYPRELKAASLLRRWVERLRKQGVRFAMNHRWTGLRPGTPLCLEFSVSEKLVSFEADAALLALGGGSWPQTGSDGKWVEVFARLGVAVSPLVAANCGWETEWPPDVLSKAEGQPLKNLVISVGACTVSGELLITKYGLEGGALYQLGPALRRLAEPEIRIDLKPTFRVEELVAKMGAQGKRPRDYLADARHRWKLNSVASALLESRGPFASVETLATLVKDFRIRLNGPRPIEEAISSAGGLAWSELDEGLMIRRLPGVFVAGEMVDWEAPTGGYLLQGCFATGTRAARSALQFAKAGE